MITMIKLERMEKPEELTEEKQKTLTEEFRKNRQKDVWNQTYIRENLLMESNYKCAYCECFVGKGYKEMNVDHFHYKEKYVEEVVKWEDLLPSCPHCRKRNRVLRGCKNILRKGIKTAEYSAFIATILQTEEDYLELKSLLKNCDLWDEELQILDEETNKIRMSVLPDKK